MNDLIERLNDAWSILTKAGDEHGVCVAIARRECGTHAKSCATFKTSRMLCNKPMLERCCQQLYR